MTDSKRSSYGNVSHSLNILLLFKDVEESTLGEMEEMLKLRKSYLLKLLADLKEKGFIAQDSETGRYRLGLSCLELGTAFENRLDIRKVSRPYLVDLSSKTNELIHLGVLDSSVVVLLDRIMDPEAGLHLQFHLSLTSPPHTTGLGKVMLANCDQQMIDNYLLTNKLEPFSPHTIVDPKKLRVELEQIRIQGYYLSYETFESGISCIAAPIISKAGKVVAAMSICAPTVRIMKSEKQFIHNIIESTLNVSKELGYKKVNL